ncbi:TPA: hypothetical protein N0F65_005280 [Lagenidium giganteum]|uniref:Sulfatase N-terminal domain-containing protein n=1 Tax=Lagenidium giganteum TaxID=4803 RepID=A0AAV2YZZ1_9STRA|nr:TPA: hypothetical protein N0F65_005280 [Lagenidium giganteum]
MQTSELHGSPSARIVFSNGNHELSPRRKQSAPVMDLEYNDDDTPTRAHRISSDVDAAPHPDHQATGWKKARYMCERVMQRKPFLNWFFVYLFMMIYFFSYRCVVMSVVIQTFGAPADNTAGTKFKGIMLGLLEDFVLVTYMVVLLWAVDMCIAQANAFKSTTHMNGCIDCCTSMETSARIQVVLFRVVRFFVYLMLFVICIGPFSADTILMRTRQMRFTFEWVKMYFNDKSAASNLQVAEEELAIMRKTVIVTVLYALAFSTFAVMWIDLSKWNPAHIVRPRGVRSTIDVNEPMLDLPESPAYSNLEQGTEQKIKAAELEESKQNRDSEAASRRWNVKDKRTWLNAGFVVIFTVFFLILMPVIVLALAAGTSHVVSNIGLNTTLNEPFRIWFKKEFPPSQVSGDITSGSNIYIHGATELYEPFGEDVLYRKTKGFRGQLAFDVKVDPKDPPNVLVLVVESFRYHDSQYMVGNNTYLLKNKNITVTPNFDRWAKRGIGFHNFWSSYRTSRSVESILFGQLPYDSVTDSGTTGGRKSVELSGMPQFFKAKGYHPMFTSGCRTDYDQWDKFLPAHGFDEVLSVDEFKALCEKDLGIDPKDWSGENGGAARAHSYWGVHDDLALQVLGNIMKNQTDDQKARMKKGEPKKPFFINHYTITSHVPYWDRPKWFADYKIPVDLSPLYEGEKEKDTIKRYVELRYFQDMALGQFMDRMEKEGILDDTIVLIMGDHGQAPELGTDNPEPRQMSCTRVAGALIAEGRLGKAAGMIIDDATEQYDMLNTLMDIVGVPEEGFIQSGIGRSLKRKIPFGERVVWSNNPAKKFAVIKGNHRIEYDRVSSEISVYDAQKDHDQKNDLYPSMTQDEKDEITKLRDAGRHLNMYFKERWEKKCILKESC